MPAQGISDRGLPAPELPGDGGRRTAALDVLAREPGTIVELRALGLISGIHIGEAAADVERATPSLGARHWRNLRSAGYWAAMSAVAAAPTTIVEEAPGRRSPASGPADWRPARRVTGSGGWTREAETEAGKRRSHVGAAGGHRGTQGRAAEARGRDPQAEPPATRAAGSRSARPRRGTGSAASWTRQRSSSLSSEPGARRMAEADD
jgi:hypothetical protein